MTHATAAKQEQHWTDALTYTPCADALVWLRTQPDAQTAWEKSERGDWMLYHAGKLAGEPGSDAHRPLVLAACECARLVLPLLEKGELRPLKAIETAERWARGGADAPTLKMAQQAYDATASAAAYASAFATDASATATAAFAAAFASAFATDASATSYAAIAAIFATEAAATEAAAAIAATFATEAAATEAAAAIAATFDAATEATIVTEAAAARAKALASCADIVRKHYPKVPV